MRTPLSRSRVNERLARASSYPVTLVVAPAGFGKSVALRDYVREAAPDAVRYDVLRSEGTLVAFVRGLSRALEGIAPSASAAFAALQQRVMASDDPVRDSASWFLEHLQNVRATVVVDDLHYAHADALALIVELVEATGERIRWIIASRSDAGLPVASWIAYGRTDLPVGEDDLRFTQGEALALAGESTMALADDEAEALRSLTGGWPVALTIALRTRTHAADLRASTSGTLEMIFRYLAEQVYAALPADQRSLLLRTCVVPLFDAAFAERLGATPEALAALRRSATFIAEVEPNVYRYHDLFREFLENELRRAGDDAVRAAYFAAAGAYEARGNPARALEAYRRAGAAADMVRVLERAGIDLFDRGDGDLLAEALTALPERLRGEVPIALGLRAMLDAAAGRFDLAAPAFVAAIDTARDSTLRGTLVHRYAIELVRHDRDAVALLEPYVAAQDISVDLRVALLGTLATAYVRAGRFDDASVTMQRAIALGSRSGDDLRARLYQQAAYVFQYGPSRGRVREYAERAVELALASGLYEVAARAYSALYAVVAEENDDPVRALEVLDRLRECARKGASRQARLYGTMVSYAIAVELGDAAAIDTLAAELAQERLDTAPIVLDEALLPARALHAAWSGAFAHAYEMLAGTAERQRTDERRALRWAEIGLYALASGAHDAGDVALATAAETLERIPREGQRVVRTLLVMALAELVRGRTAAGHRRVTEAERLLEPSMRRMHAFARGVRARYRAALDASAVPAQDEALKQVAAESAGGFARLIAALPAGNVETPGYAALTPAEREILALLVAGSASKDVAARTNRSPGTVDVHIKALCRKLGCSGRREAVAIAVRNGWFDAR